MSELEQSIDIVRDYVVNFSFQIWARPKTGRAIHIGSAFGVIFKGYKFIITAEHVVTNANSQGNDLHITHKNSDSITINSDARSKQNHFILGVPELDFSIIHTEEIQNIKSTYFYEITSIDELIENKEHETLFGLTIGYPNSKNKKNTNKNGLPNNATAVFHIDTVYSISDMADNFPEVDSDYYMLQPYAKEMRREQEERLSKSIALDGMSGAPLFQMDILKKEEYKPKLLGMLIERSISQSTIKYLRCSVLLPVLFNFHEQYTS